MGEMTGWQPVELEPTGRGRFVGWFLSGAGTYRINVSLDTLKPDRFKAITRWGDFSGVMDGIDAAEKAGLEIKINAVALKGVNEDEIEDLIRFSHGRGFDLTNDDR